MSLSLEPQSKSKFDAIVDRLTQQTGNSLVRTFATGLFDEIDSAAFDTYQPEELTSFALDAFEALTQRQAHQPHILVREKHIGTTQFIVIDIVNDDMPFLLDSVLGVLREIELTAELVAHPVFEVRRDQTGQLTALSASGQTSGNGNTRESFIHIQIRKIGMEPALNVISEHVTKTIHDVKTVVGDFQPMLARVNEAIRQFEENPPPATLETNAESLQFLRWMAAKSFIFLGIREYQFTGGLGDGQLIPQPERSLGVLRDSEISVLRRGGEAMRLTPESRAFFLNSPPVIVAKANSKSTVHRRTHMDTVGIKVYGPDRQITGEIRVAGLFTASAYNLSTRNIPLLRLKVDQVLKKSGYPTDSYSGRALINILETFPRDEMFQSSADQISRISEEVLKLELTPRARVFVRRDEFGRFLSVFVYVPRERYSTQARIGIAAMLEKAFNAKFETFTPFFSEGTMVRIHFSFWRKQNVELLDVAETELEKNVEKIIRSWRDEFSERAVKYYGNTASRIIDKYLHAFPVGYEETNRPSRAIEDIQRLEKLGAERPTDIDIYRNDLTKKLRATLLQLDEPITLSKRVPILENFGFNVISERTFMLTPKMQGSAREIFLHDSELKVAEENTVDPVSRQNQLGEGFLAVWRDQAANDRFNGLILTAGLEWRQAAVIRAYAAYLRQTGAPFGLVYVSQVLNRHASVTADLFTLFDTLFNPENGLSAERRTLEETRIAERITEKLDKIPVLDEDRILRGFLSLIRVTLRTNFYQKDARGSAPETIAFKFRSAEIEWLPAPKPYAEIFVYSPRFEGVHLRFGPIARGGLRWSDRPQDFRTEVLGLVKAQQVKNVVIVPQGAKGGFVPQRLPKGDRDEFMAEGVACYKGFIGTLLSITDNIVNGEIVPPALTVRRDGDDPYLVVAADKGTATFSDIANEIAVSKNFWLGDAFASGGSAGYDHKKMGITARGGWEAVKRHFREMNINIQETPFSVIGVGDMSGDVFGNGMLLSKAIKLVAAFDHRDIFIDPDPDPASTWAERNRLFNLPRSSWQDYDRSKLSSGGGIYSRSEKYISLSPQAQSLLGLKAMVTPNDIMTAILKAEADLLWFGGIGTFIRASNETDSQAGDRANDAIRITAKEVRAKVIGEGANLGLTQGARIEFSLNGGRCNTDAIDNSAGVNTSDVEVNIKIALGAAVASGSLDLEERNRVLVSMTDEVADAVLRNNYLQTLALSLGQQRGLSDLGFQQRMIQKFEKQGLLNRALEGLPTDAEFRQRRTASQPLTRPELAVLLAYAKIDLENDLIASTVPDDPYLGRSLISYFPPKMQERFANEIQNHQLRREIIATTLTNSIINRGGSTFVVRLEEETGHSSEDIAYAFAATMLVYQITDLYDAIDGLDGKIDGLRQLSLYRDLQDLVRQQTAWFLRHGKLKGGVEQEIERYRDGVTFLTEHMAESLDEASEARLTQNIARLEGEGLPKTLAQRLAALEPLSQSLDIVNVANATSTPIQAAAKTVFAIRQAFRLDEIASAAEQIGSGDYFDRLAVNSSLASIAAVQRSLAKAVLSSGAEGTSFETWRAQNAAAVERASRAVTDILDGSGLTLAKLTVAVAQLRDLSAS